MKNIEPFSSGCLAAESLDIMVMFTPFFCVCCFFPFFYFFQLMVNCWFGARWFGFLESPYERDCYLGVPLECQTTNPNQQLTIS